MSTSTIDPNRCPACGFSNRCALADPRTADQACWCFSVTIDPALIQALPQALRNLACLCPRCAGIENTTPDKLAP
ncbi:MAG TPA: cysteine-rich CWC family protein [Pseudomonas sp.]|jgi:hypothetical protein